MRSLIRLSLSVSLGCLLVGLFAHSWITDRAQVLRLFYPFEAMLTASTLNCSSEAPGWIKEMARFSLWENASPAGQLAYVSPDGTVHQCHYGWIGTPLFSKRVTEHSRFRYASITKLLTADMVLRQVNTGVLSLDDYLLDLLPVDADILDERLQQVTVEHLLRHSAGFDRLKSIDPMVVRNRKPWCPYDLVPLAALSLDFNPGERYAYSNLSYCLLGMIVKKNASASRSFREVMESEYDLKKWDIRFVDGPYLDDEVSYDFRNAGFYGDDYWKFFDFKALSSSAGLSGNAVALASLIASLSHRNGFAVTHLELESICREDVLRGCYGYGGFSYKKSPAHIRVYVQPGFLYASPSLAIIDERGGVTVWVGNGMRHKGSSTDIIFENIYSALQQIH